MAITPRSFRLNPLLLLLAVVAAVSVWSVASNSPDDEDQSFTSCAVSSADMSEWSEQQWLQTIDCLMEDEQGAVAYQAASTAVLFHQHSEALLNIKGYVAARNGDHATAIYDFRTGQRVTGSPSGVFENNIAWATLFRLQGLRFQRQERVLLQTRELYQTSLARRWSCERAHTALFVEYKYADLVAHNAGPSDPRVADAVSRYLALYDRYTSCISRIYLGDELVVEEVLSAAAMDAEMGKIAGISNPTRHLHWVRDAMDRARELDLEIDSVWCHRATPVAAAGNTCAEF